MNKQQKSKPRYSALVAFWGTIGAFLVVTFACLQPGWQPSSYRTSPVVCPPYEADKRGYCSVQRGDDYVYVFHRSTVPLIIHISRGSGPGGNDVIHTIRFSQGKFVTFTRLRIDPYPPQNRVDAFVQAIRDRRTELYSEMGWPDPNPPAIPPLNR